MQPTSAPVSQEYGWTKFALAGNYNGLPHNGRDYGTRGGYIVSPFNGRVISAAWDNSGFGWLMIIEDTMGYRHWLAHLKAFLVQPGALVTMGQPVAVPNNSGFSTAEHLHWSVQLPGYRGYTGFIDPRSWPGFNITVAPVNEKEQIKLIRFVIDYIAGTGANHSDDEIRQNHLGKTSDEVARDFFGSPERRQAIKNVYAEAGLNISEADLDANMKSTKSFREVQRDAYKTALVLARAGGDSKRIAELENKLKDIHTISKPS